ncbi:MAG: hypothetical protein NVV59_12250 [Chitinophagaceae bacterium]|nr:hypothetical protein [Chitinophagaceae bacterium]
MKNDLVRKAMPHVLAILIFLITALLFCKPAIEGNVLDQHDIVGWKGMAQNAFDYQEKHGHFPCGTLPCSAVCPTTSSLWEVNPFYPTSRPYSHWDFHNL